MIMLPISGTFVNGDYSGRAATFSSINDVTVVNSSSLLSYGVINDVTVVNSSSIPSTITRNRGASEPKIHGDLQGIAFGSPTTLDGAGSFGRHMQVGMNEDITQGSPSPPSLRLDYPGNMWRFRWIVKSGLRYVSVLALQNSTGSYRPSIIVKKNPSIGLNYDLSASAANSVGWTTIGPITCSINNLGVVWVELHNNNYNVAPLNPSKNPELVKAPAYFDHIIVS